MFHQTIQTPHSLHSNRWGGEARRSRQRVVHHPIRRGDGIGKQGASVFFPPYRMVRSTPPKKKSEYFGRWMTFENISGGFLRFVFQPYLGKISDLTMFFSDILKPLFSPEFEAAGCWSSMESFQLQLLLTPPSAPPVHPHWTSWQDGKAPKRVASLKAWVLIMSHQCIEPDFASLKPKSW